MPQSIHLAQRTAFPKAAEGEETIAVHIKFWDQIPSNLEMWHDRKPSKITEHCDFFVPKMVTNGDC